jgi:glucokinase
VTLAIGIDVGATKVAAGVVEVETGRIQSPSVAASDPGRGGAALLRDCVEVARRLARDFAIEAVGVAVCETVDLDGRVTSAYSFDWRELKVARAFSDIAPARIDSDVRAAAYAEARFGAGREHASFLYVNAGSGISSTLMLGGAPLAGARGNAILLGAGPLNVEALASGTALQARHGASAAELARAAEAGESSATQVLQDAGAALGQAIAFAVNLLDPELVVLGGGLALGSAVYASAAETAMRAHVWSESTKEITLVQGALGLEAGMIGAALLAAAPDSLTS